MESKTKAQKFIKEFRTKYALEGDDENLAAALHLMNTHSIDVHAAIDQSSRSSDDNGIDAWYFDKVTGELLIYQSKLSESKSLVMGGLRDLIDAKEWLESVILDGKIDKTPSNHCLYNLYILLSEIKNNLKKISFVLISLFDSNEIEDKADYEETRKDLIDSNLNRFMQTKKGRLNFEIEEYNFDTSLPGSIKKYAITKLENARIMLRKNSHLDLAYLPLYSLVDLYRQRGDFLFDKNIRLSITDTKEAKDRLVHPMENTFELICAGELSSNIFPFYHVGVTIAATTSESEDNNILSLEAPSIINGCQTITIADNFLRGLEKENNQERINKFKEIKVIAKVVIGTSDEELREITNANNRQNPIENWQLFSNDPIHIEIEHMLKELGVFYERQKGKFNTVMKQTEYAKAYPNTNNTYIGVMGSGDKIVGLGQIICLSRRDLQRAAKPSEIFLNKRNHDSVFDKTLPRHGRDIILISNYFKAARRALYNYLNLPAHLNDSTQKIFAKTIVKTYMYYVAIMHFYQHNAKASLRRDYSKSLNQIANPILVSEFGSFYTRVITKTKNWYVDESKNFKNEVSSKRMDKFLDRLCLEVGIDLEGETPFSEKSVDWSKYDDQVE